MFVRRVWTDVQNSETTQVDVDDKLNYSQVSVFCSRCYALLVPNEKKLLFVFWGHQIFSENFSFRGPLQVYLIYFVIKFQ